MVDIVLSVPDGVNTRLIAALKQRYPSVRVFPDNKVVNQSLVQLIVEAIELGERIEFEENLQAEMQQRRAYRQARVAEIKAEILAGATPAGTIG